MARRRPRKGGRRRGPKDSSSPKSVRKAETKIKFKGEHASQKSEPKTEGSDDATPPVPQEQPQPESAKRPPKKREQQRPFFQAFRRFVLALSLLAMFLLPLSQLARTVARADGAPLVGAQGPGVLLSQAVPGIGSLAEWVDGSVWSLTLFGLEIADPLAALLVLAAAQSAALLLAALVPALLTLLLGRVFCGWLCPARLPVELAAWVRRKTKQKLTLSLPWLRWVKYGVLPAGLLLAAASGWNLLALIYPPAILIREAEYLLVFGTMGLGGFVVLGAFVADLFVKGGLWCRGLCPGGALYALLARFAPLKMTVDPARCTKCERCSKVCPLGLDPQLGPGGECDRCGMCQNVCRDKALHYAFQLPMTSHKKEAPSATR